jgi:hypothetical protein
MSKEVDIFTCARVLGVVPAIGIVGILYPNNSHAQCKKRLRNWSRRGKRRLLLRKRLVLNGLRANVVTNRKELEHLQSDASKKAGFAKYCRNDN